MAEPEKELPAHMHLVYTSLERTDEIASYEAEASRSRYQEPQYSVPSSPPAFVELLSDSLAALNFQE